MIEIYDFVKGSAVDNPAEPLSLALGSFDGVHVGHRALLEAARTAAAECGAVPAVWTFEKSPSGAPELTPKAEKLRIFAALGMRYAIVCPFEEVKSMPAKEFVSELLIGRLGVRAAVCGFNHRFGRGGAGDAALLERLMRESGGICRIIEPVTYGGAVVSSSRIRTALAEGQVEEAAAMLERPFALCAEVDHGRKLGRRLGFPTVNQRFPRGHALPGLGVYACRCMGRAAVCNIGTRPTVTDSDEVICETHIIGYDGDLYGKELRVELLSFLRPEQKFASLEELSAQLERDINAASELFARFDM